MPAKSQKQRAWAFGVMGPAWARAHHYDTKGKLPLYAYKSTKPRRRKRRRTI